MSLILFRDKACFSFSREFTIRSVLQGIGLFLVLEHGSIGTNLVFQLAEHGAGDVAALDGFAVHIVVQGRGGGAGVAYGLYAYSLTETMIRQAHHK